MDKVGKVEKILEEIEGLSFADNWAFKEEIRKKYNLAFVHTPTVMVAFSQGLYRTYWMMPVSGLSEEGSPESEKFNNRDIELFHRLDFLVRKHQSFLLGEEGTRKYLETVEDRKLAEILSHGGKFNPEIGEVSDPITGEKV